MSVGRRVGPTRVGLLSSSRIIGADSLAAREHVEIPQVHKILPPPVSAMGFPQPPRSFLTPLEGRAPSDSGATQTPA